jgi:glycosyltransferase involved in cell wall biosynthesis
MTAHLPSAPLVSIVMPTYNRAQYILETIKSIQKQTYCSWELIIVDDGSDDNTRQLVNQINDERVTYYYNSHVGMEHTRKIGLDIAKGDFIGFMDSDDLWAPTKLQKQVKNHL